MLLVSSLFIPFGPASAQTLADTVFPLGGLQFGLSEGEITTGVLSDPAFWNQGLPQLGLNTLNDEGNGTTLSNLNLGMTGYPGISLGSYLDQFSDYEFFLVSNENSTAAWDLARAWQDPASKSGSNGGAGNLEWFIPAPPADPVGTAYLNQSGLGGNFSNGGIKGYLDFVYRIDISADYPNISDPSTVIYQIQYTVHYSDGSASALTTANLTFGDYTNYYTSGYQATFGNDYTSEILNIKTFPNQARTGVSPTGTNNYSVFRIPIALSAGQDSSKTYISGVDFKLLKTAASNGIFVRGVRIRSQHSDWLFRGKLNYDAPANSQYPNGYPGLYTTFQGVKNIMGNTGWKNMLIGKAGNELGPDVWRAFAYVDSMWRRWTRGHGGQKDLNYVIADSYQYWRSIYEDETATTRSPLGATPPPLQYEGGSIAPPRWEAQLNGTHSYSYDNDGTNTTFYGHPGDGSNRWNSGDPWWPFVNGDPCGPVFPGDAIPASIKNHQTGTSFDFQEMNLLITGWASNQNAPRFGSYGTTTIGSKSSSWVGINLNTYTGYTQFFQDEVVYNERHFWDNPLISSSPPGFSGYDSPGEPTTIESPYYIAAKTCYPQNLPSSSWSTFYAYPNTYGGCVDGDNFLAVDDVTRVGIYSAMRSGNPTGTDGQTFGTNLFHSSTGSFSSPMVGSTITIGSNTYTITAFDGSTQLELDGTPAAASNQTWTINYPAPLSFDPSTLNYLSRLYFKFALQTRWEIREQSWDGLAWGAKGIMFNPVGTDEGPNTGFCTSTLKTQEPNPSNPSTLIDLTDGFDNPDFPLYLLFLAPVSSFSGGISSTPDGVTDGTAKFYTTYSSVFQSGMVGSQITINGVNYTITAYVNPSTIQISGTPAAATGLTWSFPPQFLIPPISSSDPPSSSGIYRFPDHQVKNSNGSTIYIPILSDYDIYNGDPNNGGTLLYSKGTPIATDGDNTTYHMIDEYITDIQNGWTGNSNLQTYYAGLASTGWQPSDEGTAYSDNWIAWDRSLASVWGDISHSPIRYPAKDNFTYTINYTGLPTYYGITERAKGVKRVSQDLAPIMSELKKLQWRTTFTYANYIPSWTGNSPANWAQKWATDTAEILLPLTADSHVNSLLGSYKMNRFTLDANHRLQPKSTDDGLGLKDNLNEMLYDFGVFTDPTDPGALYVVITNKRTWPLIYDWTHVDANGKPTAIRSADSTDPMTNLLGAIDARRLIVSVKNASNFLDHSSGFYSVTNMRTGWEKVHRWAASGLQSDEDTCQIDFEPGEGTLLRIAPATGIVLGKTNYAGMSYNNGHRVADVHTVTIPAPPGCPPPANRGICWEENGKIMFSLVDPAGAAHPDQNYPVVTIYDPSGSGPDGHNPSIASKPSLGNGWSDTIAIVFSTDNYVTDVDGSRSVKFAWNPGPTMGDYTNPSKWTVEPAIATPSYKIGGVPDVTGGWDDLVVPAISPAIDGFVGVYTEFSDAQTFWMHVRWNNGTPSWTYTPLAALTTPNATQIRFGTVGSNDDHAPAAELWHFAWEADFADGTSTINYRGILHTFPTPLVPDQFQYGYSVEASQGYPVQDLTVIASTNGQPVVQKESPACWHRHPMIVSTHPPTVGSFSMPAITWETTDKIQVWVSNGQGLIYPSWAKGPTKPVLREATAYNLTHLTPTWGSFISVQAYEMNNLPQPVVRVEDHLCSNWYTLFGRELCFQDTFRSQNYAYRGQPNANNWPYDYRLLDPGQTPSVSLSYELDPFPDYGSISYRGINPDVNNLYNAKIVANPCIPDASGCTPTEAYLKKNLVQFLDVKYANADPCNPPGIWTSIVPIRITRTSGDSTISLDVRWIDRPVGQFDPIPTSDTTAMLVQTSWPRTEDSIATTYFSTLNAPEIEIERILEADTDQLPTILPDASHFISYKLVVKDSASGQVTQVLDSALWRGGPLSQGSSYIGTNPLDTTMTGMGFHIYAPLLPTSSGSAYVTAILTKDSLTMAELDQDQEYADSLIFPIVTDTASDSAANAGYKKAQPGGSISIPHDLAVTVYPNPVKGIVQVCVEDLPAQIPVTVDVVNQLGEQVAELYHATPEAELGLCLQLDCSKLPNGIYYADLQTQGQHRTVKFSVEH